MSTSPLMKELNPKTVYIVLASVTILLVVAVLVQPLTPLPSDASTAFVFLQEFGCVFGMAISLAYYFHEKKEIHRRVFFSFLAGTIVLALLAHVEGVINLRDTRSLLIAGGSLAVFVAGLTRVFIEAMRERQKGVGKAFGQLLQRVKREETWIDLIKAGFLAPEDELLTGKRKTLFLIAAMLVVLTGGAFAILLNTQLAIMLGKQLRFLILPLSMILALLIVAGPILLMGLFILVTAEKEQVAMELKAAHDLQMSLMPAADPEVPGFEISGACLPANEVGGDFFDYLWLDRVRKKLGIVIADVSGKAMKAAITAVMTSGMIYQETSSNGSPKKILRKINKPMYAKLDSRMFTALSFATIDMRKKELRFSNAGQTYPVLKRGKDVLPLEVKGARLPLGVKEDVPYGEMVVRLKKGDTVIFYTDGIPEAKNDKDEFYGFERFKALAMTLDNMPAKEIRDKILDDVKSFTGKSPQYDDMTVVAVRVLS
jgi:serine phosphatase RsbU (regulator of sigma subunit)